MSEQTKRMTFQQWQDFSRAITARGTKLQDSLHDKGWQLAASVGIPHDLCCIHNASIDDDMTGWCVNNPHRLKVAKRAKHILDDWTPSQIARRIIERAWNRVTF